MYIYRHGIKKTFTIQNICLIIK